MTVQIPRSLLNEIAREVNALSSAAQQQASSALDRVFSEWDGKDIPALRNAVIAVLDALMPTYTDLSAARAADFYDSVRAEQGAKGDYKSVADSRRKAQATEGAIRGLIDSVNRTHETEQFKNQTLQRIDTEVRRAANECIAYNVGRDPQKPSYARVPVGETCGFCLMLASFGFTYTNEEAAHHSHANCNCRVVPDFGDAEVEGYEPGEMYERFNDCLRALGGRDGIREEWNALPKQVRDDYLASHGNKAGEAFDTYVNKRMAAEIEARDPEWFTDGKVPPVTKEKGAHPLPKESDVCGLLSDNGFAVEFLKERNRNGEKTADAKLCGVVWEFKIPEKYNGEQTVRNQFFKARGKGTSKLLISCTENHASADDVVKWVRETFKKGDYEYIDEVLVMADDGAITRLMRPKKQ